MNPTIEDAKALATSRRCIAVAIVYVKDGQVGVSSYGHKRSTCDAMGRVADQIFDYVQDGTIDIPDALTE